jgi:gluconokinase
MSAGSGARPVPAAQRRWVIMGVSGCGKSEVGARLAARLGAVFVEGDAYHHPSSLAKMASGIPLDDSDRQGWLLALQARLHDACTSNAGLVLSCSSLKRRYRDVLRGADTGLVFVHLAGERNLLEERMRQRSGHFMPPQLLDSQFRDLEELASDECGLRLDIGSDPERLVDEIVRRAPEL